MKKLAFILLTLFVTESALWAQVSQQLINQAQQGNVDAMVQLGKSYEIGFGAPTDSASALSWFTRAAKAGSDEAKLCLSRYYIHSSLLPRDTARYFSIRQELANQGYPNGIAALGIAYLGGYGCYADTNKALQLLKKSIKKQSAIGYNWLSLMYANGDGVKPNIALSKQYAKRAWELGESDGAYYLASLYARENNIPEAWRWVNQGRLAGNLECGYLTAAFLANGLGTSPDYVRATQIMDTLLMRTNNPFFLYIAGALYLEHSAATDTAKGLEYLRRGDLQQDGDCQRELGAYYAQHANEPRSLYYWERNANNTQDPHRGHSLSVIGYDYLTGWGCKPDTAKALQYLRMGIEIGDAECAKDLAMFYLENSDYQDLAKANTYARRASELGDPQSLTQLGIHYAQQQNFKAANDCFAYNCQLGYPDSYNLLAQVCLVNNDEKQAFKYLNKGAKLGSVPCLELLGTLYEGQGEKKESNYKKAEQYYLKAQTGQGFYKNGMLYLRGLLGKGTDEDFSKGRALVQQAADSGYLDAIFSLGYMAETGSFGTEQDPAKALAYFTDLAESEDPRGQFKLGLYYELGDGGLTADSTMAIHYYQLAAEQGHPEAQCYLADFYREGIAVEKDTDKAFRLYRQAAMQGSATGYELLGLCLLNGIGTETDTLNALQLLKKASHLGAGRASANIAELYSHGFMGQEPLQDSAFHYYAESHRNGNAHCSYVIGEALLDEGNYQLAASYFNSAAQRGNVKALAELGKLMLDGRGIEAQPQQGLRLLHIAASRGSSEAYAQLGIAYLQGNGCNEDEALGKSYLDTAATLGHHIAMTNLCICYLNGYGCSIDTAAAFNWLQEAVQAGSISALNLMGDLYQQGSTTIPQNYTKAFSCYEQAAQAGNLLALCKLGHCYEVGEGVILNSQKAFEIYSKAAEYGFIPAMINVADCYMRGIYVDPNPIKALEWLEKAATQGSPIAAYYAGNIYEHGDEGITPNKKKAKAYYRQAAERGYEPAQAALNRMK